MLASSFPFEEKLGSHFWSEKDLFVCLFFLFLFIFGFGGEFLEL